MAHIDPELIKMYSDIHANKAYGRGGHKFVNHMNTVIAELGAKRVLDYGCGQTDLSKHLKDKTLSFHRYDPSIAELNQVPEGPFDLITCTDVMEHIPPQDIEDVLRHIRQRGDKVFFNISTRPASTILADGRNAHLSVLTAEDWITKVRAVFPDAVIVPKLYNQSCLIMTWNSKSLAKIYWFEKIRAQKRRILSVFKKKKAA